MSYNFAVWDGPPPLSNAHAASAYEAFLAARDDTPPTEAIVVFAERLQASVAAPGEEPGGRSATELWAAPIVEQYDGPFLYFGVLRGEEGRVWPLVEATAGELGLVAFDPQTARLLPSATSVARTVEFELPDAAEMPLHLSAVLGEALTAPTAMVGIIEELETARYVQWAVRDGGLLVEIQGDGQVEPSHRLGEDAKAAMVELGFVAGEPNWSRSWADGLEGLPQAAEALVSVLYEIRRLHVGAVMSLQTFPL